MLVISSIKCCGFRIIPYLEELDMPQKAVNVENSVILPSGKMILTLQ